MPLLKESVITFRKPEHYREVGSECQVECVKAFSNHFILLVPAKSCSKTIILGKCTTAFKLEHLKEQGQKLAPRMSFLPGCSVRRSKCLLAIPSSLKMHCVL